MNYLDTRPTGTEGIVDEIKTITPTTFPANHGGVETVVAMFRGFWSFSTDSLSSQRWKTHC